MKQLKVVFSLLLVALLLAGCGTKDTEECGRRESGRRSQKRAYLSG